MNLLPASVYLALLDDHAMFRQGVRVILQAQPYVAAVAEAAELSELLAICRQRLPDVLLLDLQMPNIVGSDAARILLNEFPSLKIIVVSMFSADTFIFQMMQLGARGYLPKDASSEALIKAIEDVLLTGYHHTPQVSRVLMENRQQPARKGVLLPMSVHFTPREEEVLQLIGQGLTAGAIAKKLFLSSRTVEGHWQRLLEKTEAKNAAELAAYAAKRGLLGGPDMASLKL